MSRRLRKAILVAFVLAAFFALRLDRQHNGRNPVETPSGQSQQRRDHNRFHNKSFAVAYVVDGDTLDIDAPGPDGRNTRIRLLGIDAPEMARDGRPAQPGAEEATQFVRDIAKGERVTIWLDVGERTRDRYGRLLAYLVLPDGRVLNELLIEKGYATADTRFPHGFYNKYRRLEAARGDAGN